MSTQTEQALLDSIPTGLFIGGQWIDGETGGTFDVQDPATGAVIRTIADATPADGIRALAAAVAAVLLLVLRPPLLARLRRGEDPTPTNVAAGRLLISGA